MGRNYTFPTLYDDVLQLSIKSLKRMGIFKKGQYWSGSLSWNSNRNKTASISLRIDLRDGNDFIELDYKSNDEPIKYRVYLTTVKSNLNKGELYYFICPKTQKRCTILYHVSGYFLHRDAFSNCMYDSQTQGKRCREFFKLYVPEYKMEKVYDELFKKNFKKEYAGKPTKRYLKLMKLIEKHESEDYREKELAMINF
jgi:hypothetical protein